MCGIANPTTPCRGSFTSGARLISLLLMAGALAALQIGFKSADEWVDLIVRSWLPRLLFFRRIAFHMVLHDAITTAHELGNFRDRNFLVGSVLSLLLA